MMGPISIIIEKTFVNFLMPIKGLRWMWNLFNYQFNVLKWMGNDGNYKTTD